MTDKELDLEFRDLISHGLLGADERISKADFDQIIAGCVELTKRLIVAGAQPVTRNPPPQNT